MKTKSSNEPVVPPNASPGGAEETYIPPSLVPLGNLQDVLAGGGSQATDFPDGGMGQQP